jgi:hypothetical protein
MNPLKSRSSKKLFIRMRGAFSAAILSCHNNRLFLMEKDPFFLVCGIKLMACQGTYEAHRGWNHPRDSWKTLKRNFFSIAMQTYFMCKKALVTGRYKTRHRIRRKSHGHA